MHRDKKTKVILAITKSNFGGAQKYVYDIAVNLDKNIYDVLVLCGGEGILAKKLVAEGIGLITIPYLNRDINIFHESRLFFDLIKIFRNERPDIVHLNSSKIGGLGSLSAKIVGVKKIIFTAHGWAFKEKRSFISRLIIRFVYIITLFLSDIIIAVSKNVAYSTPFYSLFKRKVSVIYNGIPTIDFLKKDSAREILFRDRFKNDFVIGSIGELHKNKGFNHLIESISLLHNESANLRLVITGGGEERKNLEKIIKNKKLEENILLLGQIREAAKYLKAFDLFVLNSNTESLGYVLLEAGLANLPVIATSVGGIPEIIENGVTGFLVSPQSPKEMVQKIKFLMQHNAEGKKLAQNLNKKVLTEFSLEQMVNKTEKLYQNK